MTQLYICVHSFLYSFSLWGYHRILNILPCVMLYSRTLFIHSICNSSHLCFSYLSTVYLLVLLFSFSLIANDVDHLVMCLFYHIYFFCLFKSFACFKTGLFSYCGVLRVTDLFWIEVLYWICALQIFSLQSLTCFSFSLKKFNNTFFYCGENTHKHDIDHLDHF